MSDTSVRTKRTRYSQDVSYEAENPLKDNVLNFTEAFVQAYEDHLDELAEPFDFKKSTWKNPIAGLFSGPLEALLDYLIYTKNKHFLEENECRLSLIQPIGKLEGLIPVEYFNRAGLLIPYIKTPANFDILSCVDWIVVGPGPRINARFKSISQLVRQSGLDIMVRPSHIPYTRF